MSTTASGAGRYAPSPSGDLHVGNLRTALLAWVLARETGRAFRLRVDDLDPGRSDHATALRQLDDLAALGIDHDGDVLWQSDRSDAYAEAVSALDARGLVYECYCSRREILEAPRAPHSPPGAYPGTCRNLTDEERRRRRAALDPRKQPALRLRSDVGDRTIDDAVHGPYTGVVDDFVLRRGDGVWAYNLAVVVDDDAQGVDQVVRGDDLLSSTPRQAYLAELLGLPRPEYAHVPLVTGPDGQRLAKRDGAVTLADLAGRGLGSADVVERLGRTLGVEGARTAADLLRADVLARLDGPAVW